ncbi:MAG: lysine--tRNA ligase, partial [Dehalococcoidia bacterium]|nr:lysine--tRNA ligase [Dehalococcoidia bacterium]
MPLPADELVQVRLEKLERLRNSGVDPYPSSYERTHTAQEAIGHFESVEFSGEGESEIDHVSIGGRITALRGMGRVTFCDILDGSGKIQVMFRSNTLGEEYQILDCIDIGDWIGVSGPMIRTRTGEVTVQANSLTILCKTLRPLPEKWHGLTDTEIRYR